MLRTEVFSPRFWFFWLLCSDLGSYRFHWVPKGFQQVSKDSAGFFGTHTDPGGPGRTRWTQKDMEPKLDIFRILACHFVLYTYE